MPDSTATLHSFSDFLAAARAQGRPQRLLLVFALAELPAHASSRHRELFESGEGGALTPMVCVDKDPGDVVDFAHLVEEEKRTEKPWDILFAAALAGRNKRPPSDEQVEEALRKMVEQIRAGHVSRFLAVDHDGGLVRLQMSESG